MLRSMLSFFVSRMVDRFKVSVNPCGFCGYSAVMLHTMHGSGRDEFCFTCPNDDCNEHWKSPGSEMWQPTRQRAADKWNAANDPAQRPPGQRRWRARLRLNYLNR